MAVVSKNQSCKQRKGSAKILLVLEQKISAMDLSSSSSSSSRSNYCTSSRFVKFATQSSTVSTLKSGQNLRRRRKGKARMSEGNEEDEEDEEEGEDEVDGEEEEEEEGRGKDGQRSDLKAKESDLESKLKHSKTLVAQKRLIKASVGQDHFVCLNPVSSSSSSASAAPAVAASATDSAVSRRTSTSTKKTPDDGKLEDRRKDRKERKYPCGYPGCSWIFTRTNHVARHHERVHPGFRPSKIDHQSQNQDYSSSQPQDLSLRKPSVTKDYSTTKEQQLIGLRLPSSTGHWNRRESESKTKVNDEETFEVRRFLEPEICLRVEDKVWTLSSQNNNLAGFSPLKADAFKQSHHRPIKSLNCSVTSISDRQQETGETHHKNSSGDSILRCSVERPYSCPHSGCSWRFKRQYHLNRHLVTHKLNKCIPPFRNTSRTGQPLVRNMDLCGRRKSNNVVVIEEEDFETAESVPEAGISCLNKYNGCSTKNAGCSVVIEDDGSPNPHVDSPETFVTRKSCVRQPDCYYPNPIGTSLFSLSNISKYCKSAIDTSTSSEISTEECNTPTPPPVECVLQEINDDSVSGSVNGYSSLQRMSLDEMNQRKRKQNERGIFVCDVPGCTKQFGRNCELTRHRLNHFDVWPFSCDFKDCGRKFKRKDVFKNHQRRHYDVHEKDQIENQTIDGSSIDDPTDH